MLRRRSYYPVAYQEEFVRDIYFAANTLEEVPRRPPSRGEGCPKRQQPRRTLGRGHCGRAQ
jgi:hypothetical protein